jgi:hypothetical protein
LRGPESNDGATRSAAGSARDPPLPRTDDRTLQPVTGYGGRLPEAALCDLRKTQGERPFAEIKQAMRFRRCQLRGRAKVWGEWNLVAAAANLRRLVALAGAPA